MSGKYGKVKDLIPVVMSMSEDISYIKTFQETLYLSVIRDLYDKTGS